MIKLLTKIVKQFGFWFLLSFVILYSVFPFYYAIITSFKHGQELFELTFFPKTFDIQNYIAIFTEQNFARILFNSILVSFTTVIISLTLGLTASYALARRYFKGKLLILYTILAVSMFPPIAVLSGLYALIQTLNLYNNWFGLALSYMIFTLPFTVWVLTSFMKTVPKELEEAAIVDGANPIQIILKVLLPVLAPAAVTTGLLAFIQAWNEFLFALTYTINEKARTVQVAISLISGATQYELPWGPIMAASVLVTLPLVILVLVFQKRIVAGLTAGAVKG